MRKQSMNNDPLPGSAKKKQRKRKTKNTPATPEVGTNISSNTTERLKMKLDEQLLMICLKSV